jgi:hypothetical protein
MLSLLAVLATANRPLVPDVRWFNPPNNVWRDLDFSNLTSLSAELEWDETDLGPDAVLEYQVHPLDDQEEWRHFPGSLTSAWFDSGHRHLRGDIRLNPNPPHPDYVRARLKLGSLPGRSSAAFLLGRDEWRAPPAIRYVGPTDRRIRSTGPISSDLTFPVEITDTSNLVRVEYRYRRPGYPVGPWTFGGDFGPGRSDVVLQFEDWPRALAQGECITFEFRAFNGGNFSANSAFAGVTVNNRPYLSDSAGQAVDVVPMAGAPLSLPFSATDADGDALTVLYRVGDDATWSVLEAPHGPIVLPATLVSRAFSAQAGERVIELTAFDGLELAATAVRIRTPVECHPQVIISNHVPSVQVNMRTFCGDFTSKKGQFFYAIDGAPDYTGPVKTTGTAERTFEMDHKQYCRLTAGNHWIRLKFWPKDDASKTYFTDEHEFIVLLVNDMRENFCQ